MKLENLKKIIPFHFRIGNGIGKYEMQGNKKVYKEYSVLGYIDARDAMELLDDVCGIDGRCREHKEIKGNLYCGVGIVKEGKPPVFKRDTGVESNTEKEKGEASDSFKRACVNWGIGRFLYTLPFMKVTLEEAKSHKYDLTEFVKQKYHNQLKERHNSFIQDGKDDKSK